jgi:hypothetical protein
MKATLFLGAVAAILAPAVATAANLPEIPAFPGHLGRDTQAKRTGFHGRRTNFFVPPSQSHSEPLSRQVEASGDHPKRYFAAPLPVPETYKGPSDEEDD